MIVLGDTRKFWTPLWFLGAEVDYRDTPLFPCLRFGFLVAINEEAVAFPVFIDTNRFEVTGTGLVKFEAQFVTGLNEIPDPAKEAISVATVPVWESDADLVIFLRTHVSLPPDAGIVAFAKVSIHT